LIIERSCMYRVIIQTCQSVSQSVSQSMSHLHDNCVHKSATTTTTTMTTTTRAIIPQPRHMYRKKLSDAERLLIASRQKWKCQNCSEMLSWRFNSTGGFWLLPDRVFRPDWLITFLRTSCLGGMNEEFNTNETRSRGETKRGDR